MKGTLPEKGRHKVHDQRPLLFQPRPRHQRRRRRRRALCVHQRIKNGVATHVEKLGAKLAEQFLPQRTKPFL